MEAKYYNKILEAFKDNTNIREFKLSRSLHHGKIYFSKRAL
jgi:hypothetical protein